MRSSDRQPDVEAGAGMYQRVMSSLISNGIVSRSDRILVQFAGEFDKNVAERLGLRQCTFVNLAPNSPSSRLGTAEQSDAHRMNLADRSFDHVIGHAGLHHCSRPHQALHEMYRIARSTVVAVENQDSPLMRMACRIGLAGTYEFQAVADGGGTTGGVDGTGVPNHVYRWTRHEVRKTVRTFDPGRSTPIEFYSEWLIGSDRALTRSTRAVFDRSDGRERAGLARVANRTLNLVAKRQGNIFGFVIRKDLSGLQPWMGAGT